MKENAVRDRVSTEKASLSVHALDFIETEKPVRNIRLIVIVPKDHNVLSAQNLNAITTFIPHINSKFIARNSKTRRNPFV